MSDVFISGKYANLINPDDENFYQELEKYEKQEEFDYLRTSLILKEGKPTTLVKQCFFDI